MEQQIQDLISSIKKEGIESAKAESEKIISDAKVKANEIIKNANDEKAKILEDAEKQIQIERSSLEAVIKQSVRDASLSLKKSIEDRFTSILSSEIDEEMHAEVLSDCIETFVKSEILGKDVSVELSEKDFKNLENVLVKKFSSELKNGLEFKPSQSVKSGFKAYKNDGSAYIDLTSDSCTELLMPYLSPVIRKIISGD